MLLCIITCSYFAKQFSHQPHHVITYCKSPLHPHPYVQVQIINNGWPWKVAIFLPMHFALGCKTINILPPYYAIWNNFFCPCNGSIQRQEKIYKTPYSKFSLQSNTNMHTKCPIASIIHQLYPNIRSFHNDFINIKCQFSTIDQFSRPNISSDIIISAWDSILQKYLAEYFAMVFAPAINCLLASMNMNKCYTTFIEQATRSIHSSESFLVTCRYFLWFWIKRSLAKVVTCSSHIVKSTHKCGIRKIVRDQNQH